MSSNSYGATLPNKIGYHGNARQGGGDRRKGEAPEGVRQQERGVYLKGKITGGGDSMKGETIGME